MKYLETVGGRISIFLGLLIIIGVTSYFYFMDNTKTELNNEQGGVAIFHTNLGDFEVSFFGEKSPKTVDNFKKLVAEGFYNGIKFHRVIKGFMVQGGDPLTKDDSLEESWGTGGPGYMFEDEICPLNKNKRGTLSMANAGPNTNGSQFFINMADNNFLDSKHTVFGEVISGMDVIEKIENVEVKYPGVKDIPVSPMIIESIELK